MCCGASDSFPRTRSTCSSCPRSEQVVEGYGSGFIISPDGVVITNQHVTQGPSRSSSRHATAGPAGKILGEDRSRTSRCSRWMGPAADGAVGKSTDLLIGEWVVAVGNPFAYLLGNSEPTVTAGVVSASAELLPSQGSRGSTSA